MSAETAIATAEARAAADLARGRADLTEQLATAPEIEDDWHQDGRHRLKPTRALLAGMLAHLDRVAS